MWEGILRRGRKKGEKRFRFTWMEHGVQRWAVDISNWNPSNHQFSFLLSLLPPHEHSAITRFMKFEDKKRALVSRFLQYTLVHELLGIPFNEIIIKRTVEGKPYLENGTENSKFPNFNFNSSHHGDYVAIASEPLCLVGLDVVSHSIPKHETAMEFMKNFTSCLTSMEWKNITSVGSPDEMLDDFYRYWCLKEAYIKAIGIGLGYKLDKIEFHHVSWTNISIQIDGEKSKEWRFFLSDLGNKHWACVARGHPRSAVETYKKTLQQAEFEDEEYNFALRLPNREFILRTVSDLIPIFKRESYDELS